MSIQEKDIVHEIGDFWVLDNRAKGGSYDVMQNVGTYAITLQSFAHNADGLSIAKAYANYRKRNVKR